VSPGRRSKERLVPVGSVAIKHISIYKDEIRCHVKVKKGSEDVLFLNINIVIPKKEKVISVQDS